MWSVVQPLILWVESSRYVLLFIGCIFEGPVLTLISGFLLRLGAFSFLPLYLVLVCGDFTADFGWYCFGRFASRSLVFKLGRYIGLTPPTLEKVAASFRKHHKFILIISKLTMGLGFGAVVLVSAGMSKVPLRNYVVLTLLGGFVWTGFLLLVGFFFGNVFALIPDTAKAVFVAVVAVGAVVGLHFLKTYFAKHEI